jgi:hypothetical protein
MRFSSGLSMMLVAISGALACAPEPEPERVRSEPTIEPPASTELAFASPKPLTVAPGEKQTITVEADPAGSYAVSFALIGDSLDASLDRVTAKTDADGRASVTLRASGKATTFRVRAWMKNGPSAELPVSVSGEGFGDVRVLPQYLGKREITTWTASVVARTNCAAISSILPEDPPGAIVASAPAGEPIYLKNLPVGPNLAIALRAGHFAWGCVDKGDLAANGKIDAKIEVVDKPLDLSGTDLEVTLGFTPAEGPYLGILSASRDAVLGSFLPESNADAAPLLLDAMAAAQSSALDAQGFKDARLAGGWDALATAHLDALPMPLRAQLDAWMLSSMAEPLTLRGRLEAQGAPAGYAVFKPLAFGMVDAEAAGIPNEHLVKWTGQPGDKVLLGASLFWLPSRYMAGLCRAAALTGADEGATMADALAATADCAGLATTLGAFGTCDTACLAGLCKDALAARWAVAADASAAAWQIGEIAVLASGEAKVDDRAAPLSFQGSWLGSLTDGQIVAKIDKAPVKGEPPPAEPPP